ncbi:MAG: hypothetical protein KA586_02865 [Candidatus Promineofilum sp.]|nr:hypothetical protein [Promineifilum sp.]
MPGHKLFAPVISSRFFLLIILLPSLLGYALMAAWFPLRPNVAMIPPGDIRTFATTLPAGLAYASLVLALFGLLVWAFRWAKSDGMGPKPLPFILAGTLLLALPLIWAYPVNATDIFGYVIRGRITSAYGESPFSSPAAAFVGDPFMPLVGEWAGDTTPYGPLWELIAAGLTAISGDNLLLGVLLFKGLSLACFLITTVLIWRLLPAGRARSAFTLLWAWNPALLLTFVLDGHNDALMLLWLLLGVWVAGRGRLLFGFLVMTLAVLTKPVAALALPFFFLGFMRGIPAGRRRWQFGLAALGGAILLAWLAFWPWAGTANGPLGTATELAARLAREANGGAGYSPSVWIYVVLGRRVTIEIIGLVLRVLFVALGLGLAWLGARGRAAFRGVADVFYGYVVTALNFRIWYAVWPFAWLILDAGQQAEHTNSIPAVNYRMGVGFWFLLTTQLSVVVYGHLRVYLLGGDQGLAHLIGVPLVFGLPWVLAALPWLSLSRPVHVA